MAYFSNMIVKSVLVSPAEAKDNCKVTVVDGDGDNIGTYLLDMKCEGSMLVTALLFALANFATIDYWTTDYIDNNGFGYITGIQLNGAQNAHGFSADDMVTR